MLTVARQDSPTMPHSPIEAGTVATLIRAAQGGDLKAFEQIYRLHSSRVLGLCMRMIRERDTAEDCVQQTFIKAWKNLHRFEGRSAFSTWLHGIAVNEVLSYKRANKSHERLDDGWMTDEVEASQSGYDDRTSSARTLDTGDCMDIEQALASLPDGARYVLVLQAIYGYSHDEVADMLGVAVGTCKAQLHRARRMLRSRLGYAESDYE